MNQHFQGLKKLESLGKGHQPLQDATDARDAFPSSLRVDFINKQSIVGKRPGGDSQDPTCRNGPRPHFPRMPPLMLVPSLVFTCGPQKPIRSPFLFCKQPDRDPSDEPEPPSANKLACEASLPRGNAPWPGALRPSCAAASWPLWYRHARRHQRRKRSSSRQVKPFHATGAGTPRE